VLAGRDLQAGGTWLGVTTSGKVTAVTNYRDARQQAERVGGRVCIIHYSLLPRILSHSIPLTLPRQMSRLLWKRAIHPLHNLLSTDSMNLMHNLEA
jgi:hypothetical protein